MKIINLISKGTAFLYAYIHYRSLKKPHITNKKILIIMTGHIGNAIMDINAVLEMRDFFVKTGHEVFLVCSRRLWKVCNLIADMERIHFLDVDYVDESDGTDFYTMRRITKRISRYSFEKIIVTNAGFAPLANYIVAMTQHNQSIAVFDDIKDKNGLRWYFERAYTDKLLVPIDEHETSRLKKILSYLGNHKYLIKIHYIPRLTEYSVPSRKYVTFAIDSLSVSRRWPGKYFAELANMLIQEYDYLICFTGGMAGESVYQEIIQEIKQPDRTLNFIMKTSFEQWVELLRGAEFHIGVDSGSIHIAASVGTKAFCLSGVWDATRCMPYVSEVMASGTKEPTCIYRKGVHTLPCYGCKIKYGKMGSGNKGCSESCRIGNPCYCLSYITPTDVMRIIRRENGKESI